MESLVVRQRAKRKVSQKMLVVFFTLPEILSLFIEFVRDMNCSSQVSSKTRTDRALL